MNIQKTTNTIIKKMNKFSSAKITTNNIKLIDENCNDASSKFENGKTLIFINFHLKFDVFLKQFVHELRHAQQNIIYFDFYLKEKHIKDIHNDVSSWKDIIENPKLYHYINCALEYDAYAYVFFFFNFYKEFNIKFDEKSITNNECKIIYNTMNENMKNF